MHTPLISVILPVYNGEEFISESIRSILDQTFGDFEFIIIDDGSTDGTKEVILSFNDRRIKFLENRNNQGLIKALNKGLYFSRGKYIARMDADDTCLENRFERQIDCFERNEKVDILGSWQYLIGTDRKVEHLLSAEENRIRLLLQPSVAHSSVMMKKESLTGNHLYYDKSALHAEDYKLWVDAVLSNLSICNIGEYLCGYRIHRQQVSAKYAAIQRCVADHIRIGYARCFFPEILEGKEYEYLALIHGFEGVTATSEIEKLCTRLIEVNNANGYFRRDLFGHFIEQRFLNIKLRNTI